MRALVVINPIAGRGRGRALDACAELAETTFAHHGGEADVRVTAGPGDAERFARPVTVFLQRQSTGHNMTEISVRPAEPVSKGPATPAI